MYRQYVETGQPCYTKLAAVKGPRLQLPTTKHWCSHADGKQTSVHTCGQRKGDGGRVPSSASKMASRSGELQSKQKIDEYNILCRSRLELQSWEKPSINK